MQAKRLLVTGTPGCGKTTLAGALARRTGAKLVDANALVEKAGIYSMSERGERLVDVRKLAKLLKRILAREEKAVVESHLLCEMRLSPCERIFVLRCHPLELKKRLEARKYPAWKVRENVLAELVDYCSIKTLENYPASRILEVDFTKPLSARALLAKRKSDAVDWMGDYAAVTAAVGGLGV